MKVIQFLGGLGNQMFQYAFYKALQKRLPNVKADINGYQNYNLHNGFELERIFDIKLDKISPFKSDIFCNNKWIYRKIRRVLNLKNTYTGEARLFSFDPSVFNNSKPVYYWGYWQNFKYFEDIADEIRSDFRFTKPLSKRNQEVLEEIKRTNSVSIHVRRGDYLKDSLLGGLCGLDYYLQGINYIQSNITLPKFFIFSDDISWCKENFNLPGSEIISWNKQSSSYIDMQLMSSCKHNIIANSSFSWWGAWLNENQKKIIIYPTKWVNTDTPEVTMSTPDSWIGL
jgi:hypothetical protein